MRACGPALIDGVAIRPAAPASVRHPLVCIECHDLTRSGAADASGRERIMSRLIGAVATGRTWIIAALMFPLAFAPSVALAQDIPDFDSEAYCERVAANAANPDEMRGR